MVVVVALLGLPAGQMKEEEEEEEEKEEEGTGLRSHHCCCPRPRPPYRLDCSAPS